MNLNKNCPIYKKHHNIIDGIYLTRTPYEWSDIEKIDDIDLSYDEADNEFVDMLNDLEYYFVEDIEGFENPDDYHKIVETIFIMVKGDKFYLCESQGQAYVKYATDITGIPQIKERSSKIIRKKKLEKLNEENYQCFFQR